MASWFYASEGKQEGPFSESQFRDFVTRGVVQAETLVWTEGMSGWQKASEIQGLLPAGAARPAVAPSNAQSGYIAEVSSGPSAEAGQLSMDIGLWNLLWRSIVCGIGGFLIIPAPWAYTWFYKWVVPRIHVPGRRDLGFAGQPLDIWYVFVALGLTGHASKIVEWIAGPTGTAADLIVGLLAWVAQGFLGWRIMRWLFANLVADGQRLAISFNGSPFAYVGWSLLVLLSYFTIIGWAWVLVFWMRWMCRSIAGTRRQVAFTATGLQVLWRTLVFGICCIFLIPIPWMLRWYARWYISQFRLGDPVANVFT